MVRAYSEDFKVCYRPPNDIPDLIYQNYLTRMLLFDASRAANVALFRLTFAKSITSTLLFDFVVCNFILKSIVLYLEFIGWPFKSLTSIGCHLKLFYVRYVVFKLFAVQ